MWLSGYDKNISFFSSYLLNAVGWGASNETPTSIVQTLVAFLTRKFFVHFIISSFEGGDIYKLTIYLYFSLFVLEVKSIPWISVNWLKSKRASVVYYLVNHKGKYQLLGVKLLWITYLKWYTRTYIGNATDCNWNTILHCYIYSDLKP